MFFKRLGCKDTIVRTNLGLFAVFSLIILMIVPVHAEVTEVSLGKNFYTVDEKIIFSGSENEGSVLVNVVVKDPNGKSKLLGGFSDPEGVFETIPQSVENIFSAIGTYNATAFVDKIENGTSFLLEFDGEKVFEVPDVVLEINAISDKTVEVEKTITFTASLIDNSIQNAAYSLKNAPTGATIDSSTGKFVWTPSKSHGNIQDVNYNFDIIVKAGSQEDKENITITVKQAYVEPVKNPEPKAEPEPVVEEPKESGIAPFVDPNLDPQYYVDRYNNEATYKKWFDENFAEYDSIYQAVGLEEPVTLAPFVDKTKDPQSYVDRYNNEATYKKWFDENFAEYDSIYQAVGLEEPVTLAPFVDPNLDPQYYVDRYNKETTYKKWFDENFAEYDSIYQAVGLEEPEIIEQEYGECGEGTDLVNGMCVIVDNSEGGGCLIATATYGSEMAPQVQFLREIRDNQLMSTESGMSFMSGFNQLYYSFSPTIADLERENPLFKEAVKLSITPLLSSLSVMSYAETDSEVMGYGIGVILMNLGMYVGIPAIIIFKTRKYIKI